MGKVPIENLLPRSGYSVYRLVRMASNRALELADGRKCLIENPSSDKVTTMALEEIAKGKVECKEAVEPEILEGAKFDVVKSSDDDEDESTD